ncbi:MAG: glucose-6-phosphate isomerase family protein [bacterium]|nr:glucose-6-phosphate isomerase family protein [bacterium]
MEYDLTKFTPDVRYLDDMRSVVYDQEWLKNASNFELYSMYRGLEKKDTLRYDITIIPAKMLGLEFVKTKGHYHIGEYQEVYIVLEGEAIYLMSRHSAIPPEAGQKPGEETIQDVYAVKAQKGDVVIIPPYYGHTTINPSENEDLKMANWVSDDCKSDYSLYEKFNGACYYYNKAGWIKNENYKNVPPLRFEESLKSIPEDLDFLKNG